MNAQHVNEVMPFRVAFTWMKRGHAMRTQGFKGYWYWDPEKKTIMLVTKNNERLDIRQSDDMDFTLGFILSGDWSFYNGPEDPREQEQKTDPTAVNSRKAQDIFKSVKAVEEYFLESGSSLAEESPVCGTETPYADCGDDLSHAQAFADTYGIPLEEIEAGDGIVHGTPFQLMAWLKQAHEKAGIAQSNTEVMRGGMKRGPSLLDKNAHVLARLIQEHIGEEDTGVIGIDVDVVDQVNGLYVVNIHVTGQHRDLLFNTAVRQYRMANFYDLDVAKQVGDCYKNARRLFLEKLPEDML